MRELLLLTGELWSNMQVKVTTDIRECDRRLLALKFTIRKPPVQRLHITLTVHSASTFEKSHYVVGRASYTRNSFSRIVACE